MKQADKASRGWLFGEQMDGTLCVYVQKEGAEVREAAWKMGC